MLSSAAFNAFLKTLEEPPAYAKFILATTEKHKILATILSRCQIFDFKRIKTDDIVRHLMYVASKENIDYEENALHIIAQKSDGGMRDALSIFDQIVSFSLGNITYRAVIDNLYVLDYDYYFRLTNLVIENKVGQSMLLFNEILSKGFDGQQFISGLALFFRDLLVCKDSQTIILFEAGEVVKQKYREAAALCNTAFLYKAIELTNETDLNYKISRNKRLSIELLIIRLCQLNNPLVEEDKKKILIEPVAEFTTPAKQPAPVTVSAPTIVEPEKVPPKEDHSVKKVITRFGLKEDTEEKESIQTSEKNISTEQVESFTEEEMLKAWKNCANELTDNHLKSIISYMNPSLVNNETIEILALNPEQLQYIQQNTGIITESLITQLKNNNIKLVFKITDDNKEKIPFTNREKFDYMVEKNPLLNKLQQEFELRLD
jgi:DNA polymerase-3 subunit gamma/tau